MLLAPLLVNRKGEHRELIQECRLAGYLRLRVDGEIVLTEEIEAFDKRKKHTVEAVIDRIVVKRGVTSRVTESVEAALKVGATKAALKVRAHRGYRAMRAHIEALRLEESDG